MPLRLLHQFGVFLREIDKKSSGRCVKPGPVHKHTESILGKHHDRLTAFINALLGLTLDQQKTSEHPQEKGVCHSAASVFEVAQVALYLLHRWGFQGYFIHNVQARSHNERGHTEKAQSKLCYHYPGTKAVGAPCEAGNHTHHSS